MQPNIFTHHATHRLSEVNYQIEYLNRQIASRQAMGQTDEQLAELQHMRRYYQLVLLQSAKEVQQ